MKDNSESYNSEEMAAMAWFFDEPVDEPVMVLGALDENAWYYYQESGMSRDPESSLEEATEQYVQMIVRKYRVRPASWS